MVLEQLEDEKMTNFGEFLYKLRKERGLTQADLADKLDITNKAVSKWETGESFPETSLLVPLANILNVTVDELLRGQKNEDLIREEIKEEKTIEVLPMTSKESVLISIGVALILIGVLSLVLLSSFNINNSIGVAILFVCVATAVVMFMITGMRRRMRSVELSEEEYKKGFRFIILLSVGVALAIFAPGALILVDSLTNAPGAVGVAALFSFIAVAVLFIIPSGTGWGNFIKEKNIPTDDEEAHMPPKMRGLSEALCGCIMLTATALFLVLGLAYGKWHPSWVVFPIGGILCGIISTIIGAISKKDN